MEGSEIADRAAKEESICSQSEVDIDVKSTMKQLRQFTIQPSSREFEEMARSKLQSSAK